MASLRTVHGSAGVPGASQRGNRILPTASAEPLDTPKSIAPEPHLCDGGRGLALPGDLLKRVRRGLARRRRPLLHVGRPREKATSDCDNIDASGGQGSQSLGIAGVVGAVAQGPARTRTGTLELTSRSATAPSNPAMACRFRGLEDKKPISFFFSKDRIRNRIYA